jgi:uncharacterized protein
VTLPEAPARVVTCPRCGHSALFAAANRWRPFCSERCASIDFGAWASEAYRVEVRPPAEPDAAP